MSTTWSTVNPDPAGDGSIIAVTVQFPADKVALTESTLQMTGTSSPLVAADTTRAIVIVTNGITNDAVSIDPTGGVASANLGVPLGPGTMLEITGVQAQAAMTQFGTLGQTITIFTG